MGFYRTQWMEQKKKRNNGKASSSSSSKSNNCVAALLLAYDVRRPCPYSRTHFFFHKYISFCMLIIHIYIYIYIHRLCLARRFLCAHSLHFNHIIFFPNKQWTILSCCSSIVDLKSDIRDQTSNLRVLMIYRGSIPTHVLNTWITATLSHLINAAWIVSNATNAISMLDIVCA